MDLGTTHKERKLAPDWEAAVSALQIQVYVQTFALKVPYWAKFIHSTVCFWPATVRNTPNFSNCVSSIFHNMLKHIS